MESSSQQWPDFGQSAGLELPKELSGPTPRQIPQAVQRGRLAYSRRRVLWGCLTTGALCCLLAPLPFVRTLSVYILPFAYLFWIGIGLCLLGVVAYAEASRLRKACRYIVEGDAGFGRVLQIVKTPTLIVNGQKSQYAFYVTVELFYNGETRVHEVKSRDFPAMFKNQLATRFRVGDAVPVVWFPDDLAGTLQIYDFLEVMPEASLLRRRAQSPFWRMCFVPAAAAVALIMMFWSFYSYGRFRPLDYSFLEQGFGPWIVGAGLGLLAAIVVGFVWATSRKQLAERNIQAEVAGEAVEWDTERGPVRKLWLGFILGAAFMIGGGFTATSCCFTANALWDSSQPTPVPVKVTRMIQTTHLFFIRDYSLKYRRARDGREHSWLTTPQHLSQFRDPVGVAMVREGWLGWRWVETIEPVIIEQDEAEPEKPHNGGGRVRPGESLVSVGRSHDRRIVGSRMPTAARPVHR